MVGQDKTNLENTVELEAPHRPSSVMRYKKEMGIENEPHPVILHKPKEIKQFVPDHPDEK